MKKRLIGFLLLLAMLVTMVPATLFVGSATETGEDETLPKSETYTSVDSLYDIYVTDGLVAFFDALNASDPSVDLEEGKWYAKVVDTTTGKLVQSSSVYATITGDAYDAETNPTGWKAGADGHGIGYDDPLLTAPGNKIVFGNRVATADGSYAIDLLASKNGNRYTRLSDWTVDTLVKVDLRDIPMKNDVYTPDGGSGTYKLTQSTAGGKTTYTAVHDGSTKWNRGVSAKIALSGTPGTKASVTVASGYVPDGATKDVTFDADGKATLSVIYTGTYVAVTPGADVTLESVTLPLYTQEAEACANGAFFFGALSSLFYTNKLGYSTWTDGYGTVRWVVAKAAWAGNFTQYGTMITPGTSGWNFTNSFVLYDGQRASMVVTKNTDGNNVTHTLTHGTTVLEGTYDKSKTGYDFADTALQVLHGAQGTVYTLRVYNRVLEDEEKAINAAADTLIRLGLDVAKYNAMSDDVKEFFLANIATLPADVTLAEVEQAIDEAIQFAEDEKKAKALTEYDKLYVGADGEETANGGHLVSLFTTYKGDVSSNLSQGTWINKLGTNNITLGNKSYWSKGENGGVGFDIYYGMIDEQGNFTENSPYNNIFPRAETPYTSEQAKTRLQLGLELLPTEDFTIEYTAKYKPFYTVNTSGEIVGETYTLSGQNNTLPGGQEYISAVDKIGFLNSWTTNRDGRHASQGERGAVRWLFGDSVHWWYHHGTNQLSAPLVGAAKCYRTRDELKVYAITRDETLSIEDDVTTVSAHYELLSGGERFGYHDASTANVGTTATKTDDYFDYNDTDDFYLSSLMPTDFYAVRIYDAVLTKEEMEQNRFADLAAYAQLDLTNYLTLQPDERLIINSLMAKQAFIEDADALGAIVDDLITTFASAPTAEESLYVTDGLLVLTAAYSGFHTGAMKASDTAVSWFNGAVAGESVTLGGYGWQLLSEGGFCIRRNPEEWNADYNFGIYFGAEMLPEEDYTIEMITNLSGITVENADGTVDRYVDSTSTYGTHNAFGFAIGALRCVNFPAECIGGRQSGMEQRWVYRHATYCWEGYDTDGAGPDKGRVIKAYDYSWMQTTVDDIVNYRISLDVDKEGASNYAMHTNGVKGASFTIAASDRFTNEQANNMFQLMVGMPNTVYAIRLYDRILTEEELTRNHLADIVYFYDLDQTLLSTTMELFEEDPMLIYRAMEAMDFSLTKEEAQKEFNARLAALWLNFSHTAIRNDKKEGMRFYFDFDIGNAELMVEKGYKVQIGVLANIGSGVDPTLAGSNYDYKIVVYDADMGKIDGFFVDDDTVALTILADNASKDAMLAAINVCGFVKLTDENGEEQIYYANTAACSYDLENMFTAYDHMYGLDKLQSNTDLLSYLYMTMNACYEAEYVYLNAEAAAGGDGSKDAPFNTFEAAFEESMERLRVTNRPTYLFLEAADGEYTVANSLTMTEKDNPYKFSYFTITSANNKSVLHSNRTIDPSGFTYDGDNIYIYQFEADENGNYPDFRNLYVNGQIADLAYNGSKKINDNEEQRYLTSFNRWDDGPYFMAQSMSKAKTLDYDTNPYPTESMILRTRFAYYRDRFLALRDVKKLSEETRKRDEDNHNRHYLSLDQQITIEEPSVAYTEAFYEYLLYQVAYNELFDAVQYDGMKRNDLQTYTTTRADATPEYAAQFNEIRDAYISDTSATIVAFEATVDSVLGTFSSGVYDVVIDLYAAGTLTYTTKLNAIDYAGVAYGEQFDFYRDKLLALDEVKALWNAGTLTVESAPSENGSEQYKTFFEEAKCEMLAVEELSSLLDALKNDAATAASWKSAFASVQTAKQNASAAYVRTFEEIRNATVLNNYVGLDTYVLSVAQEDAIYSGNVPMDDPRNEAKLYMQKDLVGDLSRAVTDGLSRLPALAEKTVADAKTAYDAAYTAVALGEADLEEKNTSVKSLDARVKTESDPTTKAALKEQLAAAKAELLAATEALASAKEEAKTAKAAYDAAIVYAEELLDGETKYRYSLMDSGVEMQIVLEWNFSIIQLSGVDYDDVVLKNGEEFVAIYLKKDQYSKMPLNSEVHYYSGDDSIVGGRLVWLMNLDGYLNKNNEYYYDSVAGKLYYYSDKEIDGYTFAYPQLDNMLYFNNVQRVTVFNMDFTGMDDVFLKENGFMGAQAGGMTHIDAFGNETTFPSRAPIYVYGKSAKASGISVVGCDFYELPGEAVSMHGRVDNVEVMDCSFENIGSAAIRVGTSLKGNTPLSKDYGAMNVTIENNYIDYTGQVFYNSPAVVMACVKNARIAQNTIMHTSYSAISIGWCWQNSGKMYSDPEIRVEDVEICYNYIIHFMMDMADGGAIYTLGGNAALEDHTLFNKLHDNYIVFSNITGNGEKQFFAGIYHDGGSSSWEDYKNVVVAQSYGAEKSENRLDDPSDPEMTEYLRRLRNRRERASYVYTQNIGGYPGGQQATNITYHDNYFVGSRAKITGGDTNVANSQHREFFGKLINDSFAIYENNNRYVRDPGMMPMGAENIIYASGCDKCPGDPAILYDNDY